MMAEEGTHRSLLALLPGFYANSPETTVWQGAFGVELDAAQAARDDCFLQLDVATATWGLDLWERAYGIAKEAGKSDEFRRSRILSKMRGSGTTTAALIRNVAESYSNGTVEVDEVAQEYRFVVRFSGTLGVPPNLDDLKAAIEEIKPSHLAAGYLIIYRTHGELTPYSHGQLADYSHETLRGGSLS